MHARAQAPIEQRFFAEQVHGVIACETRDDDSLPTARLRAEQVNVEEVVEPSIAVQVLALGKGKDAGSTLASTEPLNPKDLNPKDLNHKP